MGRKVTYQGRNFEFDDNVTDDEIAEVLDQYMTKQEALAKEPAPSPKPAPAPQPKMGVADYFKQGIQKANEMV